IDQALLKANIDPSRIPPGRINEVLAKLGIDPQKIPASVMQKFKMKSAASAPATSPAGDVGELMKQATVQPESETKEEAPDEEAYHFDEHGNIVPDLPEDEWAISAILVQ